MSRGRYKTHFSPTRRQAPDSTGELSESQQATRLPRASLILGDLKDLAGHAGKPSGFPSCQKQLLCMTSGCLVKRFFFYFFF